MSAVRDELDTHYVRVRWSWGSFVLLIPGYIFGGVLGAIGMFLVAGAIVGVSAYIIQVRRMEVRSDIKMIERYIEIEEEGPRESRQVVLGEGWNRYARKA